MTSELLLLLLLGDGRAEATVALRLSDPVCAPGIEVSALSEPGVSVAGTVTLRSEDVPRFALTPRIGVVRYRDPYPSGGTEWNAVVGIRAEWACTDRLLVALDAQHVNNGRTVLRHDHENPGDDRLSVGLGWRW